MLSHNTTRSPRLVKVNVTADDEGERIDRFITGKAALDSRAAAQRLIAEGKVLINGETAKKNQRVVKGQEVITFIGPPVDRTVEPENIPISIVYEDDDIIVVDKEAGMVTHPAAGNYSGTLVNALLYHTDLPEADDKNRPGIVHRLDKDTSGLLLVAKTDKARNELVRMLKVREVSRYYKVLVEGRFDEESGEIKAPITRSLSDRQKMTVSVSKGKEAITRFKVLEIFAKHTLIEASLDTGRTHQIRVHMRFINHKVVGDKVYGSVNDAKILGLNRQFLHAWRLKLLHPITRKPLDFTSEMPKDLLEALKKIKNF